MDSVAATLIIDILSDPRARADAFGDDLSFLFDDELFGLKTGTSSGWHDAWTAVFTDHLRSSYGSEIQRDAHLEVSLASTVRLGLPSESSLQLTTAPSTSLSSQRSSRRRRSSTRRSVPPADCSPANVAPTGSRNDLARVRSPLDGARHTETTGLGSSRTGTLDGSNKPAPRASPWQRQSL